MEEKCPFKPTLNLKQKKSLRDEDGLDADYFSDEFGGENDNGNKVKLGDIVLRTFFFSVLLFITSFQYFF